MNVVKLIADSPQDALEKVRDELGVGKEQMIIEKWG